MNGAGNRRKMDGAGWKEGNEWSGGKREMNGAGWKEGNEWSGG